MATFSKVDDETVIACYLSLLNGRAVARQLNMHENTVYQILRRSKSQCIRCGDQIQIGRKQCKKCLEYDKNRIKERRAEKIRLGLCTECNEQKSNISKLYCEKHRISSIERNERYQKRKRQKNTGPKGTSSTSAVNIRQKLRSIRSKYGQNGVDRFNNSGGKCSVCNKSYEEIGIHIHHIDCNENNHSYDNLSVLCYYCHKAIHILLTIEDRKRLVEWFSKSCPDKPLF